MDLSPRPVFTLTRQGLAPDRGQSLISTIALLDIILARWYKAAGRKLGQEEQRASVLVLYDVHVGLGLCHGMCAYEAAGLCLSVGDTWLCVM